MKNKPVAYYKDITFLQNRERLKLLKEFRFLALQYFENSILNMESGEYSENSVAQDARKRITFFLVEAYTIIRLADIKTAATSSPSLLFGGHGKNMDLILNTALIYTVNQSFLLDKDAYKKTWEKIRRKGSAGWRNHSFS
ncbi:MAG: hypothetical protein AMK70_10635 [Nitrospira bacterium SG8_35_1]|nr:MAG: hypothetical protein AMK70_10635 [Nitrospira bacterium SG8_35_1]